MSTETIIQRITKRELLRRIEALEREVRELRLRVVPDRILAAPAMPAGWPNTPFGPAIAAQCARPPHMITVYGFGQNARAHHLEN